MKSLESGFTVHLGISLSLCVGGASAISLGEETPTTLQAVSARVNDVAHIYFNVISGERVITLLGEGETQGADGGLSQPIWSSLNRTPCADHGYSSTFFFPLDDNSGTSSLATGATWNDWGDIAINTVVDCVHINWVTDHQDVDLNSDGVGDGVAGLGGRWIWFDAMTGRASNNCNIQALISFTLMDLPGDTSPPEADEMARYSVDVDLVSEFSNSLSFEICDTDFDPQGAAVHNPGIGLDDNNFDGFPDTDLDGDGLADWGYWVTFYQPGTADLDGDGILDGDPDDGFKVIGVSLAVPEGQAVDTDADYWTWEVDITVEDPGTGVEDAFSLYAPPNLNNETYHAGFFWLGGFKCEGDAGYTPAAMFEHQLFGPGPVECGPADYTNDGVLNFFDVSLFLQGFAGGEDYNGDGATDFFDVSSFLNDFSLGCP